MRPLRSAGSAATVAVALALIGCLTVSSCSAGTDFDPGSTTNSTTEATAAAISDGRLYPVVKVADGDTVTVVIDGVRERVRLLGIDAPELGSPGECFGRESADRAAALLTGTSVQLIADDTQDDRDRYGRLLRYVVLADGTLVNGMLVRDGDAREYTYDEPYRYQQQFRALEEEARASGGRHLVGRLPTAVEHDDPRGSEHCGTERCGTEHCRSEQRDDDAGRPRSELPDQGEHQRQG